MRRRAKPFIWFWLSSVVFLSSAWKYVQWRAMLFSWRTLIQAPHGHESNWSQPSICLDPLKFTQIFLKRLSVTKLNHSVLRSLRPWAVKVESSRLRVKVADEWCQLCYVFTAIISFNVADLGIGQNGWICTNRTPQCTHTYTVARSQRSHKNIL